MQAARLFRPLAVAGGLLAAVVAAAPLSPGLSFTMRSTTRGADGADGTPSVSRVRVQGETMRFDAAPSAAPREGDPVVPADAYTILDGPGRRVLMVMPERRQFMEIRFDDTTTQALMTGMAASATTITDVSVKGESMGAGGEVNAMPTKRYRLTTAYSYRDGGSGPSAGTGKMRVVEDYWVSDRLAGVIDPLEQVGRALGGRGGFGASPFAAVGGTSLGALLEKRAAEQRRLFRGMPARTVTTTTDVSAGGERTETRTTTEVADVVRGDLDAALFRVPEGYTRFDMRQLLNVSAQLKGALRGRANSATADATDSTSMLGAAKEGAAAGAKEGLRDGAREAAGRKIRGIFKRP